MAQWAINQGNVAPDAIITRFMLASKVVALLRTRSPAVLGLMPGKVQTVM